MFSWLDNMTPFLYNMNLFFDILFFMFGQYDFSFGQYVFMFGQYDLIFGQYVFMFGQYDFIFGQYVFMFGQYDFMREKRRLSTGDSPVERQTERGRRGMVGGCLRSSPTPQAQGPGNAWSHCTRDSARSDLWSLSWSRNDSCGPRCTPPELPPRLSRRSAHRRGRHCSVLSSAQERGARV